MPERQHQPNGLETPAPYRSLACRIGTHGQCDEADPDASPADIPVIYETCGCPCHALAGPVPLGADKEAS